MDSFIRERNEMDFDEGGFREAVERNWKHQSLCQHIHWSAHEMPDDTGWFIETAPVVQEVFGGEGDGTLTWSAFEFHIDTFISEMGIQLEDFGASSLFKKQNTLPFIGFRGTFWGTPFSMVCILEPLPNSEPVEIIDTLKQEVRTKENHEQVD